MNKKDYSFKKLLKSFIRNRNKSEYIKKIKKKAKKIVKFLEEKKSESFGKEGSPMLEVPLVEYYILKYQLEFSKNFILSSNGKKEDVMAVFKSLPMRSTILLFYLFHQYGMELIYIQNGLPSLHLSHTLLTRKLILLDNYLYYSQLFYEQFHFSAFNRNHLFTGTPNHDAGSTLSLQQNNIFFSSCSHRSGVLFYKKNLSTKYFFNYQNYFENILWLFYKNRMDLNLIKISGFYKNAQYIVDEIIYFLENRVPYQKIKARFQKELCSKRFSFSSSWKGIRISYSGRLGGKTNKAERKKIDSWSFGQTSFHILSSNLDFAAGYGETKFGIAGVKVWIASKIEEKK
jgi:hypothetical protein